MWLGFDLGTQSVRAMAVSEMGQVLGQSSQPLTSRREGPPVRAGSGGVVARHRLRLPCSSCRLAQLVYPGAGG